MLYSWQRGAQGLFLFIKLPPKSIFCLLFSSSFSLFTVNTRWQTATERESVLSTYVCTLFPCITQRIIYTANVLLHVFFAACIHASRYFPFRALHVLLQIYCAFSWLSWLFSYAFPGHRLQIPLYASILAFAHTFTTCASPKCRYMQTYLHVYNGTREQSVYEKPCFCCFYLLTQRTLQCRIEILTICLPASQLIIKLSFIFGLPATAFSFLLPPSLHRFLWILSKLSVS